MVSGLGGEETGLRELWAHSPITMKTKLCRFCRVGFSKVIYPVFLQRGYLKNMTWNRQLI